MIQSLSPFENFDAKQWQEKLRSNGFKPSEAFKLYDEMRLWGHHSIRVEPISAGDRQWDEVRLRLCERLKQIETPADFLQYRKDQADLVMGKENCSMSDKTSFINAWMSQGNYDRIERSDLISRLTSFSIKQSEQWKVWDEMELEWDDIDAAIQKDVVVQPELGKSKYKSFQDLERVVEKVGLRGFEWNMAEKHDDHQFARFAQNIENANILLEKRSGFEGPVLGINGRVNLRLGLDRTGSAGTCCPLWGGDHFNLNASADASWGVVSHEWLHALDFSMGWDKNSMQHILASEKPVDDQRSLPWKKLNEAMKSHKFDQSTSELIKSELNDGFKERWNASNLSLGMSEFMVNIRDQYLSQEESPESRKKIHQAIKDFLPNEGNVELRAEVAMTELDLLKNQHQVIEKGGSIWIQFAERFKQNIQEHYPQLKEEWADYFLLPSEQAAHSFEATFNHKNCFITDVDPLQSSLRYPLPSEALGQKLAWKRFFKSNEAWWSKEMEALALKNQATLEKQTASLPLAARLSQRRNESSEKSELNRPSYQPS